MSKGLKEIKAELNGSIGLKKFMDDFKDDIQDGKLDKVIIAYKPQILKQNSILQGYSNVSIGKDKWNSGTGGIIPQ